MIENSNCVLANIFPELQDDRHVFVIPISYQQDSAQEGSDHYQPLRILDPDNLDFQLQSVDH